MVSTHLQRDSPPDGLLAGVPVSWQLKGAKQQRLVLRPHLRKQPSVYYNQGEEAATARDDKTCREPESNHKLSNGDIACIIPVPMNMFLQPMQWPKTGLPLHWQRKDGTARRVGGLRGPCRDPTENNNNNSRRSNKTLTTTRITAGTTATARTAATAHLEFNLWRCPMMFPFCKPVHLSAATILMVSMHVRSTCPLVSQLGSPRGALGGPFGGHRGAMPPRLRVLDPGYPEVLGNPPVREVRVCDRA